MPWPPTEYTEIIRDLSVADAWYSGDENKLLSCYYGTDVSVYQPKTRERSFGVFFNRGITFWSRRANEYGTRQLARLHVPVAGDIAAKSSDFLFGEQPKIRISEAHEETAVEGSKDTEKRLREILDAIGFEALLAEAGELSSGIGGVYLVPGWDDTLAPHPILQIIAEDKALPVFNKGMLCAVTFWCQVKEDGDKIWRHLELHESGVIYHGLFLGDKDILGQRVPLTSVPETSNLVDEVKLPGGIKTMLPSYVPNMLPNRKRRIRVGAADTAGVESLMDALDETWTSWMRDVRLGQAKIAAPSDWLTRTGRGQGASLDIDQDIFIKLEVDPLASQQKLEQIQFDIRYAEHRATYLELFHRIVGSAGYAPQSFGIDVDGQAESGTALKVKETSSFKTTNKKRRYFEPAIEDTLFKMLIIDHEIFNSGITPFRPQVRLNDSENDALQTATTLQMFNVAEAMSIETIVKTAQPELEGEEFQAEVLRIKEEKGILVADPTGGIVV